jgi:hypothetical protein
MLNGFGGGAAKRVANGEQSNRRNRTGRDENLDFMMKLL